MPNGKPQKPTSSPRPTRAGACCPGNMMTVLLSDIRERKIDVVVVYKVDRLTRSLADFAKLIELFDTHGVSFVSVTQQFNTTTSMGRLTLNVLLSFAQFEREVTAERIRDKIAASKQKGIWIGGPVPLGYTVKDRKLVIVKEEAAQVRTIFRRYLKLGSLDALVEDMKNRGIFSKRRVLADGRVVGGTPYYKGGIAYLLKNRMYIGEINHKGKSYPGQHPPILDRELFDAVQAQFAANAAEWKRARQASGALLTGRLFDDIGHRMAPTNTQKGPARYRYYVTAKRTKSLPGSMKRVSAPDIEAAVIGTLRDTWNNLPNPARDPMPDDWTLIDSLLERVVLRRDSLEVTVSNQTKSDAGNEQT
jgi:site-specific DNA recombinase